MSWDNQQGPWGKNQRPPEIDEMLEKLQQKFRNLFGGKQTPLIWIVIVAALLLWLATGIFKVTQSEVRVIQRVGKYNRTVGPGLHWKMPASIEKVTKVNVHNVYTEEFGLRTVRAGVRTEYAPEKQYEHESLMLTGDPNCVLVPWVVRYQVGDPVKFLFKVRDVRSTLRDLAESTMRQIVGDHSLDEVLTKREEIASLSQASLQENLSAAETGLFLQSIELGRTNVPGPVQPSFNEVNSAIQEKEKLIYEAQGAYNKVIPEARGQAGKMIQEAEGYAVDRVQRAKGDTTRFLDLYEEYRKAKDVTRQRLYLEAMQKMLPQLGNKYVIDADQKGLLPLLNLGGTGNPAGKGDQP